MSSFYGGVSATAFNPDYVSTFYLPVFKMTDDGVLIIKNYTADLPSNLTNNTGALDINTNNQG